MTRPLTTVADSTATPYKAAKVGIAMLLFFAMMALAPPDREYFSDRADALGTYMRCASAALERDQSVGDLEAIDYINVHCRSFRDEAIKIFVPLYQQRMHAHKPINDVDVAERTILGVVLAEQMRRENEDAPPSPPDGKRDAVNLAIQPYRQCLGSYVADRLPQNFDTAKTYALGQQAIRECGGERMHAARSAETALASSGMDDVPTIRRLVSSTLCEIDFVWGWRPSASSSPPAGVAQPPVISHNPIEEACRYHAQ